MSAALSFELHCEQEAAEPPEARGLARDAVRLMVATRSTGELAHARFHELPDFLDPGDVLVINTSATLPAAVPAQRAGDRIEVRFSTRVPADPGLVVVELRSGEGDRPLLDPPARAGERISLVGGGAVELVGRYLDGDRLWLATAELTGGVERYLARHGRPIRYGYVWGRWPLESYQSAWAGRPGSAEMPSASRPFTAALVTRLVARGIVFAPLLLHCGVSSPEQHEGPYPEYYEVSAATARVINAARTWGGRVIAVGTTAVRALETVAAADGTVSEGCGWTDLVISPERPAVAVDGLVTGWHEPLASHLQMLEALGGEALVHDSYGAALEHGYLWHEFGDSHLILP